MLEYYNKWKKRSPKLRKLTAIWENHSDENKHQNAVW